MRNFAASELEHFLIIVFACLQKHHLASLYSPCFAAFTIEPMLVQVGGFIVT